MHGYPLYTVAQSTIQVIGRMSLRFVCLAVLLYAPAESCAIDSELWMFQHFALERAENRELFLTLHGRAADSDPPSLYQIQPRATFRVGSLTWAGFNYSFFGIKRRDDGVGNEELFTNQHRLEAELQFRVNISDTDRYVARNRFEYLLDSDFRNVNERIRHRSQLVLGSLMGADVAVVSQIELFYDIDVGTVNQTRTAPVGLRVPFGSWTLQAQPMIIHLKAPGAGWRPSLVANIELSYDVH